MDFKDILRAAGDLQKQLQHTQTRLAELRAEGEAGAGLVRVLMNGQHQLLEVHVEAAAQTGDRALLEDLVRAAVNQASQRLAEAMQKDLGGIAQGLGVDLQDILGPRGGPGR